MQQNLIIERDDWVGGYSDNVVSLAGKNQIYLEHFFQNYKGIEGNAIYEKSSYSVSICIDEMKASDKNCYGFDVGILDIEFYSYSSIYNEIIFTRLGFFPDYKDRLNKFFLFPTYRDALDFFKFHAELDEKWYDVEHTEFMSIYRILSPMEDKN